MDISEERPLNTSVSSSVHKSLPIEARALTNSCISWSRKKAVAVE